MQSVHSLSLAEIYRIEGYDRLIFKWWWIGLPIIALMVLLACWRLTVQTVLWWQKPRSNHNGLFRQLARIHGLSQQERSLIARLKPTLPSGAPLAVLFADPSSWAWKQLVDPQIIEPRVFEQLEKLYLKIFGFPRDQVGT